MLQLSIICRLKVSAASTKAVVNTGPEPELLSWHTS